MTINSFCVLDGARGGRWRRGRARSPTSGRRATSGAGAKVGNFVELKKTALGARSKANHLSYLGDATVGADVNVGAGTITCNYDGAHKHPTVIEDGAFIGSDTQLVAPVTVGEGRLRRRRIVDHRGRARRARWASRAARQIERRGLGGSARRPPTQKKG